MSANTVRGADARAFIKIFNSICNWNNPWDRWNDMVHLFAIEIANVFDKKSAGTRNEQYIRIAKKYTPEEFKGFTDLFNETVMNFEKNPFQDVLGQMYMELDMGSKTHGQCFTPYNVCRMMAECLMDESYIRQRLDEQGWISITDCACGGGAMLIAGAERLRELGINYQEKALFIGQDLDETVAMMCYIQMSLLGCPGRVRIGNTLRNPEACDILLGEGKANVWYTPMFFSDVWTWRAMLRGVRRTADLAKKEEISFAKNVQLSFFDR